jgi:hypothetical protein
VSRRPPPRRRAAVLGVDDAQDAPVVVQHRHGPLLEPADALGDRRETPPGVDRDVVEVISPAAVSGPNSGRYPTFSRRSESSYSSIAAYDAG